MTFIIDDAIWHKLPGMLLVVAAADGIDNRTPRPALDEELERLASSLPASWGYENAQSHPHIAAWRDALKELGISAKKHPSAIESLARRLLAGKGLAKINPLVDFYNLVSLTHVVPVGGWDIDDLEGGNIRLRLTAGGERFHELGSGEVATAEPGEVSYADDGELVTRHFVWRQAERAKVGAGTRRVFLVSEILPEVGATVADDVRHSFVAGLERHFAVKPATAILDSSHSSWGWQTI